jgi:uncharacterized protein
MPKVDLLIVQPTKFCNIDCSYCYLPHRDSKKKMELSTIGAICDALVSSDILGDRLEVCWHLGEPLTAGPAFYRDVFAEFKRKLDVHCAVSHAVQTNGVLLTEEWCELFLKWGVKVGISLDGPEEMHDVRRMTRRGEGTFHAVVKGLRLLQAHELDHYVIAVLGTGALQNPHKFLSFFSELGVTKLCFNIEETEGIHSSALLGQSDLPDAVELFFCEAWEFVDQNRSIWIRELDHMARAILASSSGPIGNTLVEPLAIVTIDCDGNWHSFCPELSARGSQYSFGNVTTESCINWQQNQLLQLTSTEIGKGVDRCKSECSYFPVCGGGSPSNKFFETGSFDVSATRSCKSFIQPLARASVRRLLQNLSVNPHSRTSELEA